MIIGDEGEFYTMSIKMEREHYSDRKVFGCPKWEILFMKNIL